MPGGENAWGESVKTKGGFSRQRIEAERNGADGYRCAGAAVPCALFH